MERGSHRLQPPDRYREPALQRIPSRGYPAASFRSTSQVQWGHNGYDRPYWAGGAPPSREASPAAVLRSSSSTRSLIPGASSVPAPVVIATAAPTGAFNEPIGAARRSAPSGSLVNPGKYETVSWSSTGGTVSEIAALMARVQSVSAKAETLLSNAGRSPGHSVMRQRSAYGPERLTDLTDRLIKLETLLDEVASLGPPGSLAVVSRPTATNGVTRRRVSGGQVPEVANAAAAAAAAASVASAGSGSMTRAHSIDVDRGHRSGAASVPVPVAARATSRSYVAPAGCSNGFSAAVPPPLSSRASGRFIEVSKAAAEAAAVSAFASHGMTNGGSYNLAPPMSGRATPPTPVRAPPMASVLPGSGMASPSFPMGPPAPIRGGTYTPTPCGGFPGGAGLPPWMAGLDAGRDGWSGGTLSTTPSWLTAGSPLTHRQMTPRNGSSTPRHMPYQAAADPRDASTSRAHSVARHRTAIPQVIPPAPAPVPLSVAFASPMDGMYMGQVSLPPPQMTAQTPPVITAMPLLGTNVRPPPLNLGLLPPAGLGQFQFLPSLASMKQDSAEGKLRQWLQTIPIGNGADRGWDDAQIAEISEFAQEQNCEHLDAQEIYKRYVEHQVEKAEEEAASAD